MSASLALIRSLESQRQSDENATRPVVAGKLEAVLDIQIDKGHRCGVLVLAEPPTNTYTGACSDCAGGGKQTVIAAAKCEERSRYQRVADCINAKAAAKPRLECDDILDRLKVSIVFGVNLPHGPVRGVVAQIGAIAVGECHARQPVLTRIGA